MACGALIHEPLPHHHVALYLEGGGWRVEGEGGGWRVEGGGWRVRVEGGGWREGTNRYMPSTL